jgi:proteic killer suppression protein
MAAPSCAVAAHLDAAAGLMVADEIESKAADNGHSKSLKRFAGTGDGSRLSAPNHERARMILLALDAASSPAAMDIPGLRFHAPKGRDKGRYSVWASGNHRITFAFDGENAVAVDLEDYH